jgi:hypothetical protein
MVMMAVMAAVQAAAAPVVTADYSFTYRYPAVAARIAPVRAWLEADRARLLARTRTDAAADRRERAGQSFPFHRYETEKTWSVVTDTPRFLSLSARSYEFTGGAHGSPGSATLLWDKAARRTLAPTAVFASAAALQTAAGPAFCAQWKVERHRRMGGYADDGFFTCPQIRELTVLLGSSGGGRINRIGLLADPYVAGSYAEGYYEITLPVTPALIRAVKPVYRDAFAVT